MNASNRSGGADNNHFVGAGRSDSEGFMDRVRDSQVRP